MKLQENQKENFINFWEFLRVPMNSPVRDIKEAFVSRFDEIKDSIKRGDGNYSPEDLKTCISAYETLSNSYSRFLHNCQIDGEEPPREPDWDAYFSDDGMSDDDLSEDDNQSFLEWLLSKANELNIQIEVFMEIANRLYGLFVKEKEKQEKNFGKRNKMAKHN